MPPMETHDAFPAPVAIREKLQVLLLRRMQYGDGLVFARVRLGEKGLCSSPKEAGVRKCDANRSRSISSGVDCGMRLNGDLKLLGLSRRRRAGNEIGPPRGIICAISRWPKG